MDPLSAASCSLAKKRGTFPEQHFSATPLCLTDTLARHELGRGGDDARLYDNAASCK